MKAPNHYNTLGVPSNSSVEDIKRAFRRKAKLYHPDRNTSVHAKKQFQRVYEAYETLGNEDLKLKYDMHRKYGEWMKMHGTKQKTSANGAARRKRSRPDFDFSNLESDQQSDYFRDLNFDISINWQKGVFVFGIVAGLCFTAIPVSAVTSGEWNMALLILCFPGLHLITHGIKNLKELPKA